MDELDAHVLQTRPTTRRPLLGMTVLLVEDSRYASDAIRLLCLRSGARIRRADCLRSARRHLQVYRPTVAIVDMGLPDGSGTELIADLATAQPRVAAIFGISGDDNAEADALAAGADGFLAKPIVNVSGFQTAIIAKLPRDMQPTGPRLATDDVIEPDPMTYLDDMAHVADLLGDGMESSVLAYVTQFVIGLAKSAGDTVLGEAARDLARRSKSGAPLQPALARLGGILQNRLTERVAM